MTVVNKYGYGILPPSQGGGGGGKTLEGTNYIFVQANGTPTQNANELLAAYTDAITRNPSANDTQTIICGNGYYDFSSDFGLNTEWINLVSLDANSSIYFVGTGTIEISANNIFVRGVNVGSLSFRIASGLSNIQCQDCIGGDYSFGGDIINPVIINGTFINCRAGNFSFAYLGIADGEFINCFGLEQCFAAGGNASGIFKNCKGDLNSFAGIGAADGEFEACTGGDGSFGDGGVASGIYRDCTGGISAWGGICSGIFYNCVALDSSFGGNGFDATGEFYNCIGSSASFGTFNATGSFYGCKAASISFGRVLSGGYFNNCVGGEESFGEISGTAVGIYMYCQAGQNSWGGSTGTLSGTLYYCRIDSGAFPTPSGGGQIILGIDGSNTIINI
jgi:hypothetical protein